MRANNVSRSGLTADFGDAGITAESSPTASNRNSVAFSNASTMNLDNVMAQALATGRLKKLASPSIISAASSSNSTEIESDETSENGTPEFARATSMSSSRPRTLSTLAPTKVESPEPPRNFRHSTGTPTSNLSQSVVSAALQPQADISTPIQSKEHPQDSTSQPEAQKLTKKQLALLQLQSAMGAASLASMESVGTCEACKKSIISIAELHKHQDKTWHQKHFVCANCQSSLVGKIYTTYHEKLYCSAHNPTTPTCSACDLPIYEAALQAMDRKFHPECFTCTSCEANLSSSYVPFEGMPFCRQCYLKRAGLVCGSCGEIIEKEFIEVFGRKYHVNCKKCDQCGTLLAGKHFFSLNGQIMCSAHKEEFMNCFTCRQPISGQVLVALSKQHQYHPEHFNCFVCKKNLLNVSYHEKNDQPVCQNCSLQTTMNVLQR